MLFQRPMPRGIVKLRRLSKPWQKFFFCPQASLDAENIQEAKFCFVPRPAQGRCITSICILSAANSKTYQPEFITSAPMTLRLRRLRQGDFRGVLARASGAEPSIAGAPAVFVCASTFWRNAWKYRARAYRHCYWDNGTILANLLAAAASRALPAKVVVGFVDAEIGELLGLDSKREAPLSLIALGCGSDQTPAAPNPLEPLVLPTEPLSKTEVEYPAMRTMHEVSSLMREDEAVHWREGAPKAATKRTGAGKAEGRLFPLQPLTDLELPQDTIDEVIVRRGSTRQFAREAISFRQLSTMLDRATGGGCLLIFLTRATRSTSFT